MAPVGADRFCETEGSVVYVRVCWGTVVVGRTTKAIKSHAIGKPEPQLCCGDFKGGRGQGSPIWRRRAGRSPGLGPRARMVSAPVGGSRAPAPGKVVESRVGMMPSPPHCGVGSSVISSSPQVISRVVPPYPADHGPCLPRSSPGPPWGGPSSDRVQRLHASRPDNPPQTLFMVIAVFFNERLSLMHDL